VHAHQPARVLQAVGDGRDADRAGVGGQHGVGGDDAFQLGEQAALGVELLDDGLDHQPHVVRLGQRGDGLDARHRVACAGLVEPALGYQAVERGAQLGDGSGRGAFTGVEHLHRVAGQGRHLHDADAHDAGAHHQHGGLVEGVAHQYVSR